MRKPAPVLLLAAAAALFTPAHAQRTQVPPADGLRLNSLSAAPFSAGQSGLWRNGAILNFRKSDGSDLNLGAGTLTLQGVYDNGGAGPQVISQDGTRLDVQFQRNAVATAQTVGLGVRNSTAATGGATQQYSPVFELCGNAWDADGSVSRKNCWGLQLKPISAAATTAELNLLVSNDQGAYSPVFAFDFNAAANNLLRIIANHSDFQVMNSAGYGFYSSSGGLGVLVAAAQYFAFNATGHYPLQPGLENGDDTNPWGSTTSTRLNHGTQNMSHSATPAFDCALGNVIHIGDVTANVTGPTMTAGLPGEFCTIIWHKDGTGGTFSINGWGANVRYNGSTSFAAGANAMVVQTFVWDDRLSTDAWVLKSQQAVQ